jgi:hypothetical protein
MEIGGLEIMIDWRADVELGIRTGTALYINIRFPPVIR